MATAYAPSEDSPEPAAPSAGAPIIGSRFAGWTGRLLALVAGLVAAIGFLGDGFALPKPVLAPFTLLGLAALILLCNAQPRRAPALAWWWGWGHFALGVHWIAEAFTFQAKMPPSLGWAAVIALAAVLAGMPALAAAITWRLVRAPAARPWVFPAAWMLTEWMRLWLFTGFPWNPLAAVTLFQFSPGSARFAAIIGAMGVSGLLVLVASGVAALVRRNVASGLVAGVAAIPLSGLMANALHTPPPPSARAVELRIVQPDIGQGEKWQRAAASAHLAKLVRNSTAGAPPRPGVPRLTLWPEVALAQADIERDDDLRRYLASLLRPGDLLLTGGLSVDWSPAGEPTAARNRLFVIDSQARIIGRYDKFHLVPGGEYVPLRPLADAIGLSRLAPGAVDFTPGPGPRTLPLPGLPSVGPLICYEIIFPAHIVDKRQRPGWLFNPSNDAWFGSNGPPQALAIARLRAIEEGLPVARSTPTGISALIGPDGRLIAALAQRTEGAVIGDLPAALPAPLFARGGHLTSLALGLLLLVIGWLAARRPT